MNYEEAVALGMAGDGKGFQFLYEETYKDKYYIAIKYMKNEEDAKDVLQDAYMRAFSKIAMLRDPNAFSGWLSQIVANTAKNALLKKNPILFSEMDVNSDNDKKWEEQIEDEKTEYRPEETYTKKETQALVHELIDSLSDEQRLCMLMFYIEEQSIKDIAAALDCSENTVKSRLNYGRKNLKSKAEDLQKKGYKLYSAAPLSLLLYLLRTEREMFISIENAAATSTIFNDILSSMQSKEVVKEGIKEGAKQAFIQTMAGKITATVASIAIVGTIVMGTIVYQKNNEDNAVIQENNANNNAIIQEDGTDNIAIIQGDNTNDSVIIQEDSSLEQVWIELPDSEYSNFISGNLTKEQLEFMLGHGPETITDGNVDNALLTSSFIYSCEKLSAWPMEITELNWDSERNGNYSADDINRIYSVFKDNAFTSNSTQIDGIAVRDNIITVSLVSVPWNYDTTITLAKYFDKEMTIEYDVFYHNSVEGIHRSYKRTAHLEKQESGKYQIKNIESIAQRDWKQLYLGVLKNVKDGESSYKDTLPSWDQEAEISYEYSLCDMDNDSIPELIINLIKDGWGTCSVYKFTAEGDAVKQLSNDNLYDGVASTGGSRAGILIPQDGNGLLEFSWFSYNSDEYVSRITIMDDTLVRQEEPVSLMDTDNKAIEWKNIEDVEALKAD